MQKFVKIKFVVSHNWKAYWTNIIKIGHRIDMYKIEKVAMCVCVITQPQATSTTCKLGKNM
jgi:hypothetical protein